MRRLFVIVELPSILLAALLLGGCQQRTGTRVTIEDLRFVPVQITVPVGSTVTWTNRDQTAHTITADGFVMGQPPAPGQWNSGPLNPGQSFSQVFNQAGTYPYHCMIHPYMHGTVVVQ